MKNLDDFLDRFRSRDYVCWDHTCEVWKHLTDVDLTMGFSLRKLREIPAPVNPCIVYMEHSLLPKHVGVYHDGRIIHLAARGVEYMEVALVTRAYGSVRFFV